MFCSCMPPSFGPGCAFDGVTRSATSYRTRRAPHPHPLRLFVYDLPAIVLHRKTYLSDHDPIFSTYHALMRQLLHLPERAKLDSGGPAAVELTPDPEDAHLFLVPAFGTNMFALLEYYMHAVSASTVAIDGGREHGADHVFMITLIEAVVTFVPLQPQSVHRPRPLPALCRRRVSSADWLRRRRTGCILPSISTK